jgi:disulfide bond formation protein DsbB
VNRLVKLNFLLALIGTTASLYFSEVMRFAPCSLCWYQRICLFPLVFIFAVAIWSRDRRYWMYALPLSVAGLAISIYHNSLYYGFVAEALSVCTTDISCSAQPLELFGFITIPLLSMIGFIMITGLLFIELRSRRDLK